jgi:transcriptional regulator with XRE-family HTH domain
MSTFSERLEAYLAEHPEWNPAKLALAAGLDNSAIRKILNLKYSPRMVTVQKIADALNEPIETFTSDAPKGGLEEIQRLFALLTPEEQAMIKTAVAALVAQRRDPSPK